MLSEWSHFTWKLLRKVALFLFRLLVLCEQPLCAFKSFFPLTSPVAGLGAQFNLVRPYLALITSSQTQSLPKVTFACEDFVLVPFLVAMSNFLTKCSLRGEISFNPSWLEETWQQVTLLLKSGSNWQTGNMASYQTQRPVSSDSLPSPSLLLIDFTSFPKSSYRLHFLPLLGLL